MLCIVQARMSSRRLPGKVLMQIQGKTLIERVVERVHKSKYVTRVIVATTTHDTDRPLRKLCYKKKIEYYAGSLPNVAHRFYEILINFVFLLKSLIDSKILIVPSRFELKSVLGSITDFVTATWPAQCINKLGLIFLIILETELKLDTSTL